MEVISLKCPGCDAPVSTEQKKCEYCGNHIIIQNLRQMERMPMLQINKYAASYRKTLEENPDHIEVNCSIGACYLKLKLYDKALAAFEKAMQDNFEMAEPYYMAAIALLEGKKAFVAQRASIDRAVDYLNSANMIEPKAIHYYFLAYIKQDYFDRKFLKTSPGYKEMLDMAAELGMTDEEADEFFDILNVPRPSCM